MRPPSLAPPGRSLGSSFPPLAVGSSAPPGRGLEGSGRRCPRPGGSLGGGTLRPAAPPPPRPPPALLPGGIIEPRRGAQPWLRRLGRDVETRRPRAAHQPRHRAPRLCPLRRPPARRPPAASWSARRPRAGSRCRCCCSPASRCWRPQVGARGAGREGGDARGPRPYFSVSPTTQPRAPGSSEAAGDSEPVRPSRRAPGLRRPRRRSLPRPPLLAQGLIPSLVCGAWFTDRTPLKCLPPRPPHTHLAHPPARPGRGAGRGRGSATPLLPASPLGVALLAPGVPLASLFSLRPPSLLGKG